MSPDAWQLAAGGPESYERYQVPSVFEPLARVFLQHVALRPGQQVLDVACGTGIVSRLAAPSLGIGGSIVGVDLNEGMLALARANSPASGASIEWRTGDAGSLPGSDAEFDVVLCQQGLQFFPDRVGALVEMRRVLKPKGRIGLCVWSGIEHSPCHRAIADALRRHVGEDVARRFQAPFAFGDPEALRAAVVAAGFGDVDMRVEIITRRLLPPDESIPGLLGSTPVGPEVASRDEATRLAIIRDVADALSGFGDAAGLQVPQSTNIVLAVR